MFNAAHYMHVMSVNHVSISVRKSFDYLNINDYEEILNIRNISHKVS